MWSDLLCSEFSLKVQLAVTGTRENRWRALAYLFRVVLRRSTLSFADQQAAVTKIAGRHEIVEALKDPEDRCIHGVWGDVLDLLLQHLIPGLAMDQPLLDHCTALGAALAGLVYLEILPLTELASLIDARICLPRGGQEVNRNLNTLTTYAVHAYLNSGKQQCIAALGLDQKDPPNVRRIGAGLHAQFVPAIVRSYTQPRSLDGPEYVDREHFQSPHWESWFVYKVPYDNSSSKVQEGGLEDLIISTFCSLIRRLIKELHRHVAPSRALAAKLKEALKHEYSHPLLPEEAFNYAAICLNFVNGLLILGTRLGMPLEPPDALPIINALAGALAALIALNVLSLNKANETLYNTQGTSSLMRKANIYKLCQSHLTWHLRAYLKCVAIGENLPLHHLGSAAMGAMDNGYIYRRIHEQMGAMATGAHPFVLRKNPLEAYFAAVAASSRASAQGMAAEVPQLLAAPQTAAKAPSAPAKPGADASAPAASAAAAPQPAQSRAYEAPKLFSRPLKLAQASNQPVQPAASVSTPAALATATSQPVSSKAEQAPAPPAAHPAAATPLTQPVQPAASAVPQPAADGPSQPISAKVARQKAARAAGQAALERAAAAADKVAAELMQEEEQAQQAMQCAKQRSSAKKARQKQRKQALAEDAASNHGVPDKDQAGPGPCTAAKPACAADSPPESAAPNTDTSPAAVPAGPGAASSQAEAADVADMPATSADQAGAATLSGAEQVQQAAKQRGAAEKARDRSRKQGGERHGLVATASQQQAGAGVLNQAADPQPVQAGSTAALPLAISLDQLVISEPGLLPDSIVMQAAAQNKAFAETNAATANNSSFDHVYETEECVVCWAAGACIILQPCGHMCTCEACNQFFKSPAALCPMCRARVKGTISVAV